MKFWYYYWWSIPWFVLLIIGLMTFNYKITLLSSVFPAIYLSTKRTTMRDLYIEELAFILGQMKSLQAQNPKAKVVYDLERKEILITFPLPKDFPQIKDTQIDN